MNNNWFSVGEEIVLQHSVYPEKNGEYRILGIISAEDYCKMYKGWTPRSAWCYDIGVVFEAKGYSDYSFTRHVSEIHLRKKHRPAEVGYYEMMNNLMKIGDKV